MLLGNSTDFDAIRARYQSLSYPTPEQAAFNATRASYQGLLTGSGYGTTMVPSTIPGQGVTFSVDPTTGQVTTNIPQYDMPTFQNIYDEGLGLIGEDGLPIGTGGTGSSYQMGQPLPQRGGDGRENLARMNAMRDRLALRNEIAENMDQFNMLPGYEETQLPGLLGFIDETLSNIDREIAIDRYMRDIEASQEFGKNKYGLDTSYTGSAGTDPSKGETPTSGPSGDDDALGKGMPGLGPQNGGGGGGNFGGDTAGPGTDASTAGGTGGRRGGAGPW